MQISDNEVKNILKQGTLAQQIDMVAETRRRTENADLVAHIVDDVKAMDDREERIAELQARIQAGTYNPTGAEITNAMIRRNIADRLG